MLTLLIALGAAATAYFAVSWLSAMTQHRNMTKIERAQADIADARELETKPSVRDRFTTELKRRGWTGDPAPVLLALAFLYLIVALALRLIGIDGVIGSAIALPVAAGTTIGIADMIATSRRRKFNRQLLQALNLIAGQLEAGNGIQRSMEQVIPSLAEPLRGEFSAALEATVASKDLVGAMRDLSVRYPSRAMSMFVSALELDRARGGRIEPALRQAAGILARDFDLAAEAQAELAQVKTEFLAVLGIALFVVLSMIGNADDTTRAAYLTPLGLIGMGVGLANMAVGVWRTLRMFAKARGDR